MIALTCSEKEYLQLHRKIRALPCSDAEKLLMVEALDYLTSIRLKEEISRADSLEYYQDEVKDTRSGMIGMIVIGFIISYWFSAAFTISIIIAVLGYIGNSEERRSLKYAKQAKAYIDKYRSNGFQI